SESFNEELHRVMIHGILHFCGYKDKTTEEERLMRDKENNALELLGKR
ncbi:MAG: putative rRNA maturation factor, partial [Candidatus Azotimanducaceae bacterium]